MSFLPRTRRGFLWRALLGAVLVIGLSAGATATTGLLTAKSLAEVFAPHAENLAITLPKPGAPETLLIIGSDHRAGDPYTAAHTDTMLLMRLDDNSSTINVMSVPRDLEVLDPTGGYPVKLNSVYAAHGGPNGLIKVLRHEVFGPRFAVNHVVDVNFQGFSDLIDAIGCVDTMVDHRYYNLTAPGPNNYSSIDIQPGYQKLCGGINSPTGANSALAFVRFRHTDSDIVRTARQQDFIRWARDGYSTTQLIANQGSLTRIFARHSSTDRSLATVDGLIELFNLILDANKLTLKSVGFPEFFGACNSGGQTPCYVYPCPDLATCSPGYAGTPPPLGQPTAATRAIWQRFITPTVAKPVVPSSASTSASSTTTPSVRHHPVHHHTRSGVGLAGLTADTADGLSQARALGRVGLPIYYPRYILGGAGTGYCFSLTGNCDNPAEPGYEYRHSYPRRYLLFDNARVPHRSYVMTLVINALLGQYYNVEGTTWQTPPILRHPSDIVHVAGRTLDVYADGGKIGLVAFHTPRAVYWVSNSLDHAIPNAQMVALAAELTPAA